MSHPVNDLYLEDRYDSFMSSENGTERCAVLRELKDNGFDSQVDSLVEEWFGERNKFLEDHGVDESHLLIDEEGVEFWYDYNELGTPGDDYQIDRVKVEVPKYLDVDYWIDNKIL